MPWELPITIDGDEYPVSFENEPTEQDVQEAVRHLESQRAAPQSLAGAMGTQLSKSYGETLFSQPMQGISGLMEILPVGQEVSEYAGGVAQDWQRQIEQDNPINPEQAERFPVKAAGAVGQGLGMLTQMATMGGLGLPSAGVRAATLGTAGLAGAGQGQQEADRLNITDPVSRAAMILGTGGIEAGTEMLGGAGAKGFTQALLGEVKDFTTSLPMRFLKTTGSEGLEEMIAEPAQTQLARALAEEDPANLGFTKEGAPLPTELLSSEMAGQTLEAGALGAVGGAVFGGIEALSARQSLREGMQLRARIQEALSQEQDEGLKQQLHAQDQNLSQKLAQGGISPQLQSVLLQAEAEVVNEDVPINPDVAMTANVAGPVEPVVTDPDVAMTAAVVSEKPTIETTDEIETEIQPEPILEPATAEIADSGLTGGEAAVEQPSDLPTLTQEVNEVLPTTEVSELTPVSQTPPVTEAVQPAPVSDVTNLPAGEGTVTGIQEAPVGTTESQLAWEDSPEFAQAEELAAAGDIEAAEALEASFREKQAQTAAPAEIAPEAKETAPAAVQIKNSRPVELNVITKSGLGKQTVEATEQVKRSLIDQKKLYTKLLNCLNS